MSDFSRFMKENKEVKEDYYYPASSSFKDENGETIKWRLRHITSKEYNDIADKKCTVSIPVPGKPGQFTRDINETKLVCELLCAAIVEPDLRNAELQDSYGVHSRQDLLMAMLDNPGEYALLAKEVSAMDNLDGSFKDKVEEAKNL